MGHVRSIPQKTQAGNESGQVSLEITYGGKESPFGGIDTSAPAAYIDPRCFTNADGFFISDNQLCVASLQTINQPVFFGGDTSVVFLKAGTFYNSLIQNKNLNYALGGKFGITADGGYQTTYYITSWKYINGGAFIQGNDQLTVRFFPFSVPAVSATLTLSIIQGQPSTFTDAGTLAVDYAVAGVLGGTVTSAYAAGATIATVVAAMVVALNAASGATGFTAAPSDDGNSIILTAVTPGVAGNTLQVADHSTNVTHPGTTPPFYFPIGENPSWTELEGGAALENFAPSQIPNFPVASVEVGGTIYFGNLGPLILKYSGPGEFTVSSTYAGAYVLGKFAGSLIGLGQQPQNLNPTHNIDMIISWTAANVLDEWNPVTAAGLVTGAGFTQLDDIADPLTGIIVSNNTAFLIRAQGVSYATAIGNGKLPFSFAHIGIGDQGDGCQNPALVCQFNETGFFVGNSNIFQISGRISPIGDKVSSLILQAFQSIINNGKGNLGAEACVLDIGKRPGATASFLIGSDIYLFAHDSMSWMLYSFDTGLDSITTTVQLATISSQESGISADIQNNICLIVAPVNPSTPTLYSLQEGIGVANSLTPVSQITFPQEELLFGRDVVINSIYFSMNAIAGFDASVSFYFNNILFATYNPIPAFWTTLEGNPVEVAVYPSTVGVYTSHSPQLTIKVGSRFPSLVRISKIQIYASMEPEQRPVS